jgi:hypothetical protein
MWKCSECPTPKPLLRRYPRRAPLHSGRPTGPPRGAPGHESEPVVAENVIRMAKQVLLAAGCAATMREIESNSVGSGSE